MKKLIKYLFAFLLVSSLTSCGPKNDLKEGKDYYVFTMRNDSFVYNEYFGIEDTKSKEFLNQNDLDAFNSLIANNIQASTYCEADDIFNLPVNFNTQKVIVTAAYVDHNVGYYDVDVKLDNDHYYETITYEVHPNYLDFSTYLFVYLIEQRTDKLDTIISFKALVDNGYVCYKPVLYFYNKDELDLEITYVNSSNLITTYPKYNNGWNIHLNGDDTFTYNNRNYYAIYFDEYANYTTTFKEGFYVTKDNAISFLEEKLDILGYSELEANEFIMYWLPVLEENEQSLVYFETTDIRNNECPLLFSTQPDSVLRTIIHIKKVDQEITIKEQQLPTFERTGFCVVEWGGIKY